MKQLASTLNSNKRIFLICLLMAALAIQFWTGSRYPQLNEKALMGGDATLESPMSFEAVVVIQDGDSLIRKILLTTVNWADENRKGMTFGILFGAAFLTFFRLFQRRGSNSGFINTLMGVGAGAPLGVCVNCAAPIAKGLHDSGARLETTLSAMFSSPTLNIIILTMLLSIFPIYLSAVKIGFTLLFILVFVPVLCRTVFKQERTLTYNDGVCPLPPAALPPAESWSSAIKATVVDYFKSLWYLFIRTVPLMLVAGFLGAVAVNVLPLDKLAELDISLWQGLLVGALGIFLPVPIALDVVLAAALLASGLPVFYATILVFTLGIYSIYPFFIVWRSISLKVAVVLAVVLVVLGVMAGYLGEYLYQRELSELYEYLE